MNCQYTDEELKSFIESYIGIQAKEIEKIEFTGFWHIHFRAFGTDFYCYKSDSNSPLHLVECPWNWD